MATRHWAELDLSDDEEIYMKKSKNDESAVNWSCLICSFSNHSDMVICEMCEGPKADNNAVYSKCTPVISQTQSSNGIQSTNVASNSSSSVSIINEEKFDKICDSNISVLPASDINQALLTSQSSNWVIYNDLMYKFNSNINRSNAMISFDMDGTLITTKSGKKFATNENDWKLWDTSIPNKLRKLHEEGKYLAIISNQNGIKAGKTTTKAVQDKVDAIMRLINVPMDFICSMEDDLYRKPRTGMLEFLVLARCPDALKTTSLYVGDAAGRVAEGTHAKDFADTDLKLALNLGIPFQTPEHFFLNSTQRLHTTLRVASGIRLSDVTASTSYDPSIFTIAPPPSSSSTSSTSSSSAHSNGKKQDIVLLVAPPACGKTTLSQRFIQNGYMRVNQDTLKTIDKCIAAGRKYLLQGQSVCVDNTNMKPDVRAKWIQLGKEFNIATRCVVLRTPKETSRSLAMFRMLDPYTPEEDRRHISSMVVNMFYKEPMAWPTMKEGFSRIDTLDFMVVLPKSIKSLRLFKMYLK